MVSCKFDGDRSSKPRDSEVTNFNFWDDTAKIAIPAEYLRKYRTDLHQLLSVGMCVND